MNFTQLIKWIKVNTFSSQRNIYYIRREHYGFFHPEKIQERLLNYIVVIQHSELLICITLRGCQFKKITTMEKLERIYSEVGSAPESQEYTTLETVDLTDIGQAIGGSISRNKKPPTNVLKHKLSQKLRERKAYRFWFW